MSFYSVLDMAGSFLDAADESAGRSFGVEGDKNRSGKASPPPSSSSGQTSAAEMHHSGSLWRRMGHQLVSQHMTEESVPDVPSSSAGHGGRGTPVEGDDLEGGNPVGASTNSASDSHEPQGMLRQELDLVHRELQHVRGRERTLERQLSESREHAEQLELQVKQAYEEVRQSRSTIDRLRSALQDSSRDALHAAQGRAESFRLRAEAAESEVQSLRQEQSTTAAASRDEVLRAESAMNAALRDLSEVRASARRREEDLAAEVAELSGALAAAQRALDKSSRQHRAHAAGGGRHRSERGPGGTGRDGEEEDNADDEDDAREAAVEHEEEEAEEMTVELRDELQTTAAALRAERHTSRVLRQEVQSLQAQRDAARDSVDRLRQQLATLQTDSQAKTHRLEETIRALQEKMSSGGSGGAVGSEGLSQRLESTAQALVRAEDAVSHLRADRTALEQRLQTEMTRNRALEAELDGLREPWGGQAAGTASAVSSELLPPSSGGVRLRGDMSGSAYSSSSLLDDAATQMDDASSLSRASAPARPRRRPALLGLCGGLRQWPRVARLVDGMDKAVLDGAALVGGIPWARAGLIVYLLLLHAALLVLFLWNAGLMTHGDTGPDDSIAPHPVPGGVARVSADAARNAAVQRHFAESSGGGGHDPDSLGS